MSIIHIRHNVLCGNPYEEKTPNIVAVIDINREPTLLHHFVL